MKQNVGVIFSSTHRQDLHVVIFADSCEIGPEARLQFFFYDFAAVFGAEDEVHVILGECVGQWAAPSASRRPQADGVHPIPLRFPGLPAPNARKLGACLGTPCSPGLLCAAPDGASDFAGPVPTASAVGYLVSPLQGLGYRTVSVPRVPRPTRANSARVGGRRCRPGLICAAPDGASDVAGLVPTASAVGYLVSPLQGLGYRTVSVPRAPRPTRANSARVGGRRCRSGLICAAPDGASDVAGSVPTASAVGYLVSPLRGCTLDGQVRCLRGGLVANRRFLFLR